MHPVLEKIKMKSFEGELDIHGTAREVCFAEGSEGEPSVLVIKGLPVADALHVLDRLRGGLLKDKDAENPPRASEKAMAAAKKDPDFARKSEEKPEPVKATNGKPPKLEAVPKHPEEAQPEDADDLDGGATPSIDIEELSKLEKLRDVIEYLAKCGYKTAGSIVKVSSDIKEKVPALMVVDGKGGFEKRMERAALVVLGGETAS
jgi:hypothetical protein